MLFQTYGDRRNPAVLFFHAMGVTGASSEPVAKYLQDRFFCILPTSTVYCEGQKYVSKLDEIRQVEDFLHRLLRQYMHNTEIAVTMRLSTILKTIKQPL